MKGVAHHIHHLGKLVWDKIYCIIQRLVSNNSVLTREALMPQFMENQKQIQASPELAGVNVKRQIDGIPH